MALPEAGFKYNPRKLDNLAPKISAMYHCDSYAGTFCTGRQGAGGPRRTTEDGVSTKWRVHNAKQFRGSAHARRCARCTVGRRSDALESGKMAAIGAALSAPQRASVAKLLGTVEAQAPVRRSEHCTGL